MSEGKATVSDIEAAAGSSSFFRNWREISRKAAVTTDEERNLRRQCILDRMTEIIRGGGAWSFNHLIEEFDEDDRVFMLTIFPAFVAKLKGAYPLDNEGRLFDLTGVAAVLDLVRNERGRPYADVLRDFRPLSVQVGVELAAHAGDIDRVEVEDELAALQKMPPLRRTMATVLIVIVRGAETMLRKVRRRMLSGARRKPLP
jgi:hypothetical protein